MGVCVAGMGPLSQAIYGQNVTFPLQSSVSRRSLRQTNECFNCGQHGAPSEYCDEQFIVGAGRPLSLPPSVAMTRETPRTQHNSNGNFREANLSWEECVPSRASCTAPHQPPPTCVPWLKKMKVIRKLQRKIGIGSGGSGISASNMPPLLFHPVCGENVTLSENGAVARRSNSFCKAIVFSNRAVAVNEKVSLKFVEVSKSWSGVLRLGFTAHNPANLSTLPKYACPDLTSKPGFWAKALSEVHVKQDAILYFYVNAAGHVYFGIDGQERELFFSGVDTRHPLWLLIDLYGNTTAIQLIDPRAQLNNSRSNVSEVQSVLSVASNSHYGDVATPVSRRHPVNQRDRCQLPPAAAAKVKGMFPAVVLNVDQFNPLTKGKHALVSGAVGYRREGEYLNSYLFPNQPLHPGETLIIHVQRVDYAYASSMAFGLTSSNPRTISGVGFPDDSNRLENRSEYWVVRKDVADTPAQGDILAFTLTPDGFLILTKNDELPKLLLRVDLCHRLYPFFDLYGTTQQIQLAGIVPANYYTAPAIQAVAPATLPRSLSLPPSKCASLVRSAHSSAPLNNSSLSRVNPPPCSSASVLAAISTNEINSATYATIKKLNVGSSSQWGSGGESPSGNMCVECVVCCERAVDSVFYPCGHMCMCYACALQYWKSKEKGSCPICRAPISDVIRTYKS